VADLGNRTADELVSTGRATSLEGPARAVSQMVIGFVDRERVRHGLVQLDGIELASQRLITTIATPLPTRLVNARHSLGAFSRQPANGRRRH
jgi:hypothetical protein